MKKEKRLQTINGEVKSGKNINDVAHEVDYYFYKDDENGDLITDGYYVDTEYNSYEYNKDRDITLSDTNSIKGVKTSKQNIGADLKGTISKWYVAVRNIAIVGMMIVLLYIGIRMVLSTLASDKAKYKQMLQDWFMGLLLIFLMHYIMAFSIVIVQKITDAISTSVDKNIYMSVIPDDDGHNMRDYIKNAGMADYLDENEEYLFYPSNLMGYARIRAELATWGTEYIGWSLCFIVLVLFTLFFTFTYLKRVLYMAFLTIIAPLVALTYPIDKLNDGSAQGFDKWFKEYIFNLLIQPMHLLLYYILVTSAFDLASDNILYSLVAIGFMIPAEKLLRSFFGFEKAHTPGLLAGPGGAALTMHAIQKLGQLGGRGGKDKLSAGKGNSGGSSSDEDSRPPRMNGDVDGQQEMINMADGGEDGPDTDDNNPDELDEVGQQRQDYIDNQEDDGRGNNNPDELDEVGQQWQDYIDSQEEDDDNVRQERIDDNNDNNDNNNDNDNQEQTENAQQNDQNIDTPSQSKLRKLARRAKRGVHTAVGATWKAGIKPKLKKENINKVLGAGAKGAIRFTAATAAGTIGLAAGIAGGDPKLAFQNVTTAGLAGDALGKGIGNRLTSIPEPSQAYKDAANEIRNGKQYEDLQREDYIKNFKKENKDVLVRNFGKEKAKKMMGKDGIVEESLKNGIENVEDIVAEQRMIDDGQVKNVKQAIAVGQYAKRVGSDYNTANASKWEDQFTRENIDKAGKSDTEARRIAKAEMRKIEEFNKQKKNSYK